MFRLLIYGIIFGVYAYTLQWDIRFMPRFGINFWVSKLVMLSVLNLVLQTVYSGVCLICAVFDWLNQPKERSSKSHKSALPSYWRQTKMHSICDFMYFTSAFPVGTATCLLFWGIYLVSPEAVMPKWMSDQIPAFYNHVTHTAPIVFLLIDTLLTCHHSPKRFNASVVVIALFVFYAALILSVRYSQGYWLYPIFDMLTFNYQIALFVIGGVLFWFLYLLGDGLNTLLWGRAVHVKSSEIKSKST